MKSVLHGMTAAAVAMTLAMAFKTGKKCLGSPAAIALFVVMFVFAGVLHRPLWESLAICGPIALWLGLAAHEEGGRMKPRHTVPSHDGLRRALAAFHRWRQHDPAADAPRRGEAISLAQ